MEFENFPSPTVSVVLDGKGIGTGSMAGRQKSGDEWQLWHFISIKGSRHIHLLSMGWVIFQRDLCCFNGIIYRKENYTSVMGLGGMSKI